MPATDLPDPFALVAGSAGSGAFAVEARRELSVFGSPAELLYLPRRKQRPGAPLGRRPPFQLCRADSIVGREAVWRVPGIALTGNPFPFAQRAALLWSEHAAREAPLPLLETGMELAERTGGTLLLNSTGAAASVARAHMHLVGERLAFLERFATEPFAAEWLEPQRDVAIVRLGTPFPIVALGLLGTPGARARATHRLLQVRTTAAVNLVSYGGVTWVFPRSERETPAPHFPVALGSAELWGRWCYVEREPFERATAADLEQAITCAGIAW